MLLLCQFSFGQIEVFDLNDVVNVVMRFDFFLMINSVDPDNTAFVEACSIII